MKISIGADHAGVDYKNAIIAMLTKMKIETINRGTDNSASVDYPDHAHPVASDVQQKQADLGILICGSGNGVCMTANKHDGIRAALCWKEELAALARSHNDANVLCIPARFVSLKLAKTMVKSFVNTPFEGGRHANRVNKISCA
jgi:ribose 5-phosphate isomerase B